VKLSVPAPSLTVAGLGVIAYVVASVSLSMMVNVALAR